MVIFMLLMFRRRDTRSYRPDTEKDYGERMGTETALDILKKRFASGEINREDYEVVKGDLDA